MFSNRLKYLRENAGYSQYSFAAKFGVSQSTVGNWEAGIRKPGIDVLVQLADFFGVTTDYLLGRTDYPHGYVQKAPPDLESAGVEQVVKTKDEPLTAEEIEELRRFLKQLKG